MSVDKWMDEEVVVPIHNGILLSCEKECIWVCSNEVDEPRAYYTEWSTSEREGQVSYINAYVRNLERVSMTLHAGHRRRHEHKEQIFGCRGGRRGWDGLRKQHWNIYITIHKIGSGSLMYDAGYPKPVLCDNLEGQGGEGGGRRV